MKNFIVSTPYNFNPKWTNRSTIQRAMGQRGKITRAAYDTAEMKNAAREACKAAVGPCLKGEAVTAQGCTIKNKGGVMPRALMG